MLSKKKENNGTEMEIKPIPASQNSEHHQQKQILKLNLCKYFPRSVASFLLLSAHVLKHTKHYSICIIGNAICFWKPLHVSLTFDNLLFFSYFHWKKSRAILRFINKLWNSRHEFAFFFLRLLCVVLRVVLTVLTVETRWRVEKWKIPAQDIYFNWIN